MVGGGGRQRRARQRACFRPTEKVQWRGKKRRMARSKGKLKRREGEGVKFNARLTPQRVRRGEAQGRPSGRRLRLRAGLRSLILAHLALEVLSIIWSVRGRYISLAWYGCRVGRAYGVYIGLSSVVAVRYTRNSSATTGQLTSSSRQSSFSSAGISGFGPIYSIRSTPGSLHRCRAVCQSAVTISWQRSASGLSSTYESQEL